MGSEYSQTSPFFRQSPVLPVSNKIPKYDFWEQASKAKPIASLTNENIKLRNKRVKKARIMSNQIYTGTLNLSTIEAVPNFLTKEID